MRAHGKVKYVYETTLAGAYVAYVEGADFQADLKQACATTDGYKEALRVIDDVRFRAGTELKLEHLGMLKLCSNDYAQCLAEQEARAKRRSQSCPAESLMDPVVSRSTASSQLVDVDLKSPGANLAPVPMQRSIAASSTSRFGTFQPSLKITVTSPRSKPTEADYGSDSGVESGGCCPWLGRNSSP